MAKIFITGRNPVEITKDEAVRINEMWVASRPKGKEYLIPEVLEAGGHTFLAKDIKGFEFGDGLIAQERAEYDLFDEAQKAKVKAFIREFDDWKAQHPEITEWHQWAYMQERGAIKMGKHRPDDEILNYDLFRELQKLFSSRQTLIYSREKARANNDPNFEADRVAMFQQMKEGIKTGVFNPALAKIKADAKAFDEKYGIVGDIDPKLIPF